MEEKMGILQIHAEGRKYETVLTQKFLERKVWKEPDRSELRSVIPGTVLEMYVKEGDTVKKGDRVMLYEAMKMHNVITAPFDGTVRKIHVKEGDVLPKDALMINLDSDKE